jgi:hypothetical protein
MSGNSMLPRRIIKACAARRGARLRGGARLRVVVVEA